MACSCSCNWRSVSPLKRAETGGRGDMGRADTTDESRHKGDETRQRGDMEERRHEDKRHLDGHGEKDIRGAEKRGDET